MGRRPIATAHCLSLSLSHTHAAVGVGVYSTTRNEDSSPIALRAEDSLWIDFQYATRGLSKTESRIILPPPPPVLLHFSLCPSGPPSVSAAHSVSRSFRPFIPFSYRSPFSLHWLPSFAPFCPSLFPCQPVPIFLSPHHTVFLPSFLPSMCLIHPSDGVLC